jgi:hypothetical protein
MKKALSSSETSVLTRATRHYISEDDAILHSHRRENLKSYLITLALIVKTQGLEVLPDVSAYSTTIKRMCFVKSTAAPCFVRSNISMQLIPPTTALRSPQTSFF